ncbi:TonB-dependent siderophore receptor [Pseudoduganella sp. FT93W]|uniref:TonB-dependent siderophore receptor n=1 Tax=Duganella fentianensis TaxID=2692177 RepID=A0A845I103_9BURK|nr:TonB-dependent siderophore receptor [Duganella fentianensis]MYN45401.1 TonB-dependent siderophore receptor [Duganella fentianensis]
MNSRRLPRPTLLAALMSLAFNAAAGTEPVSLPTINVNATADAQGYLTKAVSTATKTDTALADLPQAVTVISEALIRDQSMQSMADVVRYVPGIGMTSGEGNRDAPVFRGSTSASGDFYMDGVRDDAEYYRDLYNVEQVDALTGPNAMMFGRGGSGGVINRVSKQANFSTIRALDLTAGNYRKRRMTADLGQAINEALAVRVAALAEDSGGYQRAYSLQRKGINPTLAIRADKATSVVLGYEHFEDYRTADRGVPALNGRPLDVPVDAFFGNPDPETRPARVLADTVSGQIEHRFANGLQLSNKTRYTSYDKLYQNISPGAVNAATSRVTLSAYNNHQWRKNLFNQTDLTMLLQQGGISHQLLAGMELGQQKTDYLRQTGLFANQASSISVPLAQADAALPVSYVLGGSNSDRDGRSKASVAALYLQDQISFNPQWQLVAGLRYDAFRLDYHNNVAAGVRALLPAAADLSSRDNLLSPRMGLVYKPLELLSLYANYSVASVPRGGDQLSSLTVVNQSLKPEKFTNYEAGAKLQYSPDLLATLALYRLNRNNVAVTNPATGIADQLVDGQRTNGLELSVSGKLSAAWQVQGAYAYQDAKLLASVSATALNGATVNAVPRQTLSLWNRYDLNDKLGAGLGLIHRTDMYASTSNAVVLPGFTRIDAALYYTIHGGCTAQLNIENLTDRHYYAAANGDNNITPGSPRAIRASLHLKF